MSSTSNGNTKTYGIQSMYSNGDKVLPSSIKAGMNVSVLDFNAQSGQLHKTVYHCVNVDAKQAVFIRDGQYNDDHPSKKEHIVKFNVPDLTDLEMKNLARTVRLLNETPAENASSYYRQNPLIEYAEQIGYVEITESERNNSSYKLQLTKDAQDRLKMIMSIDERLDNQHSWLGVRNQNAGFVIVKQLSTKDDDSPKELLLKALKDIDPYAMSELFQTNDLSNENLKRHLYTYAPMIQQVLNGANAALHPSSEKVFQCLFYFRGKIAFLSDVVAKFPSLTNNDLTDETLKVMMDSSVQHDANSFLVKLYDAKNGFEQEWNSVCKRRNKPQETFEMALPLPDNTKDLMALHHICSSFSHLGLASDLQYAVFDKSSFIHDAKNKKIAPTKIDLTDVIRASRSEFNTQKTPSMIVKGLLKDENTQRLNALSHSRTNDGSVADNIYRAIIMSSNELLDLTRTSIRQLDVAFPDQPDSPNGPLTLTIKHGVTPVIYGHLHQENDIIRELSDKNYILSKNITGAELADFESSPTEYVTRFAKEVVEHSLQLNDNPLKEYFSKEQHINVVFVDSKSGYITEPLMYPDIIKATSDLLKSMSGDQIDLGHNLANVFTRDDYVKYAQSVSRMDQSYQMEPLRNEQHSREHNHIRQRLLESCIIEQSAMITAQIDYTQQINKIMEPLRNEQHSKLDKTPDNEINQSETYSSAPRRH